MPLLNSWSASIEGQWDDAIQGGGALLAGVDRLARDEIALTLSEHIASLLWDIQKFFDSVDLFLLIEAAPKLGYHPNILALVMQLHMAIRSLRVKDASGQWIIPTRSIPAGCRQACFLVKAFLHPVMQASSSITILVRSSQYIDDVTQVARGSIRSIVSFCLRLARCSSMEFGHCG